MADDFIDGRAAGFGEVVVVERGGVAVPRCAGLRRDEADTGHDRRAGPYELCRLGRTGQRFCLQNYIFKTEANKATDASLRCTAS